jgi:hypothetical protein
MPKLNHLICQCANCGQEFTVQRKQVEEGRRGKYCSLTCKYESTGYKHKVLAAMPGTLQAICARTGYTETTAIRCVKSLRESSACHVSQVVPAPADRSQKSPDFRLCYDRGPGGLADVPIDAREALSYFYRLMVLASMPATQSEICEITGLSKNAVLRIVRAAQAEKQCHIISWRRAENHHYVARHAAGPGHNRTEPKLIPLTGAESSARYKERLTKRGKMPEYLAKHAKRQRDAKLRKKGDPFQNLFFGTPSQRKQKQEIA